MRLKTLMLAVLGLGVFCLGAASNLSENTIQKRGYRRVVLPETFAAPAGYLAEFDPQVFNGANLDVDVAAPEHIWAYGGTETLDAGAAVSYHISSADDADTMDVRIVCLDATYLEVTTDITLAGQTETDTLIDCTRLISAVPVGTSAPAGIVYIYIDDTVSTGVPQTDAKVRGTIPIGQGKLSTATTTIPLDHVGLLYGWSCAGDMVMSTNESPATDNDITTGYCTLLRTPNGGVPTVIDVILFSEGQRHFPIPIRLGEGDDLRMLGTTVKNDTAVFGSMNLLLLDEEHTAGP